MRVTLRDVADEAGVSRATAGLVVRNSFAPCRDSESHGRELRELKKRTYTISIDRNWIDSSSGERYTRESPAHDVVVGDYPLGSLTDVDKAVAATIDARKEELALMEVLESGKPISRSEKYRTIRVGGDA
jgi:hypothetical protein